MPRSPQGIELFMILPKMLQHMKAVPKNPAMVDGLALTIDSGAEESVCGPFDAPGFATLRSKWQARVTCSLASGGRAALES